MKTFIATVIPALILFLNSNLAQATGMEQIGACENITKMGMLAQNEMPYWAAKGNDENSVQACYEALKNVIAQGDTQDVETVKMFFPGIQIFPQAHEFAQFLRSHQAEEEFNPFDNDSNSPASVLPVNKQVYFNLPASQN